MYGIDFARAIFMVLGLVYHAGLIYGLSEDRFLFSNENSVIFNYISDFTHQFRMHAFYIIAGFFYMLVFNKGHKNFISDRVMRLGVPLIVCGFTLNSIMNYFGDNPNIHFDINYILNGQWVGHLWFLSNLIVYSIITLSLNTLIQKTPALSIFQNLILFYFIVPIISVLGIIITRLFGLKGVFIFISLDYFLYYYAYFLVGCLLGQHKQNLISLIKIKYFYISMLVYLLVAIIPYLNIISGELIHKIFEKIASAPLSLAMLIGACLIGNRLKNTPFVKKLSDASYTIYLVHQPLLITLYAIVFQNVNVGVYTEYFLLISIIFLLSFGFHEYCVQKNKYLKFLFNGVSLKK
jgi:peptidoglycan/LPS O-acetylase OafA/YrhL